MKAKLIFLFYVLVVMTLTGCTQGKEKTGLSYLAQQFTESKSNIAPAVSKSSVDKVAASPKSVNKTVYLTFDDGPDSFNTPVILDILDNYQVKATFFVIGTLVEQNPSIVKDIVKRGHAVGNHTYNHKYNDVYAGRDGFLKSLRANGEVIYRTVGFRPYIVRDPGGKVRNNANVRTMLANNNYWLVDWNVDSYDSRTPGPTAPEIIENIRQQSENQKLWPGMVILMHDGKGHANTVRALPTIIEMLQSKGFKFDVIK